MTEKTFDTTKGSIHYWTNGLAGKARTLVLLPGLTADHRLFEKQTEVFADEFGLLTWDAPGHAMSRPFSLDFTLADKADWLGAILDREGIESPILIGQSMGGYVSQCFLERFPGRAAGFISIDSAPLQRSYVTAAEIWLLKRTAPIYRFYPWEQLKSAGIQGCAETPYGRALMAQFVGTYTRTEYIELAANGYRMLAEAMEQDLPYEISCPALLVCGEKDKAASTKRYNRAWAKKSGIPIRWIEGAGHNSNTDRPEEVNAIIRDFVLHLPDRAKGDSYVPLHP